MIEFYKGTIFNVNAQAIVNTVNCDGFMGAGIALEFSLRYPDMYDDYKIKCEENTIQIGKVDYFTTNDKIIVNFPTKLHFQYDSKLSWIELGLKHFIQTYKIHNIKSIAFPKLGTANGGLDWEDVKQLMEKYLSNLDIKVYICLDTYQEAEGIEKRMVEYFNIIDFNQIKKPLHLSSLQVDSLSKSRPISRFFLLLNFEKIGLSTYKKLFTYFYSKALSNNSVIQLSFLN